MVMEVRLEQPEKAPFSMDVTPSGMLMEVRLEQPEKADCPMDVTASGMVVFLHPAINLFDAVSIMALHPLRESYFIFPLSTVMEVRLEQPSKAHIPMDVTPSGMLMEVRLEQYQKALLPMDVTASGMVMEVRLEQP